MRQALRPCVTIGVAMAGASIIAVTPVAPPPPEVQVRAVQLTDASTDATDADVALVMGGSSMGIPTNTPGYVEDVSEKYIDPHFPGYAPQGLFTPENLYGLIAVKNETLDQSVAQGVTILNNAITQQIDAGNHAVVFGYSQSTAISTLEMRDLMALPPDQQPNPADLGFVLIGDVDNPNGGMLERFDGLTLPAFGITFYGATPPDIPYPTDIYTIEYDGFADYPQYPIDLLADANAAFGIQFLHDNYPYLPASQVESAIPLPTSPDYYADGGVTHYYMIPEQNLPLLALLRDVPVVGNPLADLIQPDLKVLVNLGYGNPDFGWSQGPANVPTPFGLFPNVNPITVLGDLGQGAEQGVQDFVHDLSEPSSLSLPSLSNPLSLLETALSPTASGASLTDIINTLTGVVANDYAVLLPTADVALSLAVTLPTYDASIFLDELEAGNLVDAVTYPIAAEVGVGSLLGFFELNILLTAPTIMSAVDALVP